MLHQALSFHGRALLVLLLATAAPAAAAPWVGGRVETEGGRLLAGAKVVLHAVEAPAARAARLLAGGAAPEPAATATVDRAGRFRLEAPQTGVWRVEVVADGFAARETLLGPLVADLELPTVELKRAEDRRVQVSGPEGPVVGAWVVVRPAATAGFGRGAPAAWGPGEEGWREVDRWGVTGPGGISTVPWPVGEPAESIAAASRFAPVRTEAARGAEWQVRLVERPLQVIETRAVGGGPLAGVVVWEPATGLPVGSSGPQGRLAVAAPAEGSRRLAFRHDSGTAVASLSAPSSEEAARRPMMVTLARPEPVAGRVIDRDSGRPLAGAWVVLAMHPHLNARTDGAGAWSLSSSEETWGGLLRAAAPGYLHGSHALLSGRDGPTLALRPAAMLVGRVVDSLRAPLAGVEVIGFPRADAPGAMRRFGLDLATARTGADGSYHLPQLAPGGYDVHFTGPAHAPRHEAVEALAPGERRVLDVVLFAGTRATGTVTDSADRPLAAAVVTLHDGGAAGRRPVPPWAAGGEPLAEALTDQEGRFTLSALPPGRYELRAEATGHAPTAVPGVEVPEGAAEIDLGTVLLAPGAVVAGRVVDAVAAPLSGAEVTLVPGGGRASLFARYMPVGEVEAVTDGDGRFSIGERRQGEVVDVVVALAGYATEIEPGVEAPTIEPVTVTLRPAARLSGQVRDEAGRGVQGALIQVGTDASAGGRGLTASLATLPADDDGHFLAEGLPPGRVSVLARAPGFVDARRTGIELVSGEAVDDIELVVRQGAIVQGVVTTPDGRPAIEAMVTVRSDSPQRGFGAGSSTLTDGDGHYRLDGVEPGERTVEAQHVDWERAVATIEVVPGDNALDLELTGGQEVAGRVIDASGAPVAGATVGLAAPGSWSWRHQASSGTGGAFRLPAVPDGSYQLSARHRAHPSAVLAEPVVVAGAPILGLEIQLPAGAEIVGRLLGLELAELPRVTVWASGSGGSRRGEVAYDGSYRIGDVGPGDWAVGASVGGAGRRATGRVSLAEGEPTATLDLDFTSGLTLSGTVTHADEPLAGATVSVRGLDLAGYSEAQTDREGAFRLENLDPGAYSLEVTQLASGLWHVEEVEVREDREIAVRIASARLGGTAVDALSGEPLTGVAITLAPEDAALQISRFGGASGRSDDGGRWDLGTTPAGRWLLRARLAGYAAVERTVVLAPGDAEEIALELQPTEGLTLQVAGPGGAPPGEVRVAVVGGAGVVDSGRHPTGEGGRVRLSSVPAGQWQLLVSADGSATVRTTAQAPGPVVTVALATQAVLEVSVPDLADRRERATLTLTAPDGSFAPVLDFAGNPRTTFDVVAGRATLTNLPAGTWTVTVAAPGGGGWIGQATTTAGGHTALELP